LKLAMESKTEPEALWLSDFLTFRHGSLSPPIC